MGGRLQVQTSLPEEVFRIYEKLELNFSSRSKWEQMEEEDIWHELCLCILSSNVPYELACSSLSHLIQIGMLDNCILAENPKARISIANELAKPIYHPLKKDGNFRKYRFPRVRAENIVDSARILYREGSGLIPMLTSSNSEELLRNYLAEVIPGLGLKESSHFLRNIGYSSKLAIIDVHIISFLKELQLLPSTNFLITSRNYFYIEDIMRQISKEYNLNLAVLDNAIWHYMRSFAR